MIKLKDLLQEFAPAIQIAGQIASKARQSPEDVELTKLKKLGEEYAKAINNGGLSFEFYDEHLKPTDSRLIFTMKREGEPVTIYLTHDWKEGQVKWIVFSGWKTFGKGKEPIDKVIDVVKKTLESNKDKIK